MRFLPVCRVAVFVPATDAQRVIDGVCAVDGRRIGDCAQVAWTRGVPRAVPSAAGRDAGTGPHRRTGAGRERARGIPHRATTSACGASSTKHRAAASVGVPASFFEESRLPLA